MLGRKLSCVLFIAIFVSLLSPVLAQTSNEEMLAQQAEQTGNLREALLHYVNAYHDSDIKEHERLLLKCIGLAKKLDPPETIPEEAIRHTARGKAAFELAKDQNEFLKAVDEFGKALWHAPWDLQMYRNLGIAWDKAGKYAEALWALKIYLRENPAAQDTTQVSTLIYKIEYRQEEAARTQLEQEAKEAAARKFEALSHTNWTVLVWNNKMTKPTRFATDWVESHGGTKAHVSSFSIKGNEFKLTIASRGQISTFTGTIQGNNIQGTMSYKLLQDSYPQPNPQEHNLEGTIWPDESVILLITKGYYWLNSTTGTVDFLPDVYSLSYLLKGSR